MKKICRTLSAIFQRVYYQLFAIWQSLIAKLWAPTVFTTMIATSSLQNYKKVIEYGRFSQKLKIIAKILATFRNNIYLCTQNNGRVPFIGIGVSPIGRVVRFVATLFLYTKRTVPFFVCTIKMLRITNTFSKKSCLETAKKHRPMTVMTDDSFLNLRRKEY